MPNGYLLAGSVVVFVTAVFTLAWAAPTHASLTDAPIPCQTPTDMQRLVRSVDSDATITFYRQGEMRAMLRALLDQTPHDPLVDLSRSTVIGTFVSSNPDAKVLIRFYDEQGCDFYGVEGPPAALQQTLQHMGVGA